MSNTADASGIWRQTADAPRFVETADATQRERAREAGNFDQTQVEAHGRNMHVIEKALPWLTQEPPPGSVY